MRLEYTGTLGANQDLVDSIAQAWGYVLPGGRIQGTSGARPGGRSSSQHYTGNAWDYGVYRPDGSQVRWDDPEVLMAAEVAASMGLQGFGWGPTYMGGSYFHFDDGRNPHAPRGGVQFWSDDDGGAADRGPGAAQYGSRLRAAAGMSLEDVLAMHALGAPVASGAAPGNALAEQSAVGAPMPANMLMAAQAAGAEPQGIPQQRQGNVLDPRAFMGAPIQANALLPYVVSR